MSSYVFWADVPYRDYVLAKSFEEDVADAARRVEYQVARSALALIASDQDLARQRMRVVRAAHDAQQASFRDLTDRVESGVYLLSFQMGAMNERLEELGYQVKCGFDRLLVASTAIHDELKHLLRVASTPAMTWAYEQYETARDAMRRHLYPEAMEALDRAIRGFGTQPGYPLDFRFHYLQGQMRLGDELAAPAGSLIDPLEAEQAFLRAARYAKFDHPADAAAALIRAAWAKYCAGEAAAATDHTRAALALDATLAEAHYLAAKFQMHLGRPDEALSDLEAAIRADRNFAKKAAGDGDFLRHWSVVEERLLGRLVTEARGGAERARDDAVQPVARAAEWARAFVAGPPLSRATDARDQAAAAFQQGTYDGYLDAAALFQQAAASAGEMTAQRIARVNGELHSELEEIRRLVSEREAHLATYAPEVVDKIGMRLRDCERRFPVDEPAELAEVRSALREVRAFARSASESALARHTERERRAQGAGRLVGSVTGAWLGFVAGAAAAIPIGLVAGAFTGILGVVFGWPDGTAQKVWNATLTVGMVFGAVCFGIIGAVSGGEKFRVWFAKLRRRDKRR